MGKNNQIKNYNETTLLKFIISLKVQLLRFEHIQRYWLKYDQNLFTNNMRLINLSVCLILQRQNMNRILSNPSAITPFFENRHSRSTSYLAQEARVLIFTEDARKKGKECTKYRNIHKKFSENRIDTLDDVLAITLKEVHEAKSQSKPVKVIKKAPIASVLLSKCINQQQNPHSKSNKSFKESIRTFSSQDRLDGSLSLKKRSINQQQLQKVTSILNNLCNKSVKSKFQQKSKHSITQWINLVHQIEKNSRNKLHMVPMVNQSKLVIWTESKIIKIAELIYEQIIKNSKKSQLNQKLGDLFDQFEDLSVIIKAFFMKKYKTSKLMKQNLANLIYSIEYHLSKQLQNGNTRQNIELLNRHNYLRLFQDILSLKYEAQDVLFCLFSRKNIEKLLKTTQTMSIIMNESSSHQFFKLMTQNDEQLIKQYQFEMKKHFKSKIGIDLYSFLAIIMNDYKQKRIKLRLKQKEPKNTNLQSKYYQRVSNQLSFINYEYDQTFWLLQTSNTLFQPNLKNQIQYQAKRLVDMLCSSLPIEYKTFIKELLVIKSVQVVQVVQKFNKKNIFLELGLYQRLVSQQQKAVYMKTLQELRNQIFLVMNSMKNGPNDAKINERFAKKILTTPLLSNKLYQLFEYFQALVNKQQINS